MKTFIYFLLLLISVYVVVTTWVYLNQNRLIFFPSPLGPETPKDFGTVYEDIYFTSMDGTKLHGWWIPQQGPTAQGVSLLYCHGNGATLSMLSHVASIFHSYGVDTFMFNYRGYGASEGEMSDLSEEAVHHDARAALAWLREKKPGQPVIVWGHSLGSSVASRLAMTTPLSGLILEGAFSSIADMARHRYPLLPVFSRFLHSPFETISYLQDRHDTPLLMMHTEFDSIIPISLGEKAYAAAPEPKEWIRIRDADHNEFPDVHHEYRDQIVGWINRYTSGTVQPR